MDISTGSVDEGDGSTPAGGRKHRPPPRQPASGRWVESSWDLCRGLTVHEGLPADANLDEWLEAVLRG